NLLARAEATDTGIINTRVLAGGALSGTEERHPLGSPPPAPIGSGADYHRDVERARRFEPLVREGQADSLIEASLRYVIAHPAVSTVLVGYSTMDHLEYAARAIAKGPLSAAALARVAGGFRAYGLQPGDRVLLSLENSGEFFELLFGCWAAGLCAVPANARLHPREVEYIADNSAARLLVATPALAEALAPLAGAV